MFVNVKNYEESNALKICLCNKTFLCVFNIIKQIMVKIFQIFSCM